MPNAKPQDIMIEDDGQEDWMKEEMMKEERLARMEIRRKEWERDYICKGIIDDILERLARSDTDKQALQDRTYPYTNFTSSLIQRYLNILNVNCVITKLERRGHLFIISKLSTRKMNNLF